MWAAMIDAGPDVYKQKDIDEKRQKVEDLALEIGLRYSLAMGDVEPSDDMALKRFREYDLMHSLATGKSATHEGVIANPDFHKFWNSIDKAYEVWENESDPEKKGALLLNAQQLFGFYGSFEKFKTNITNVKETYLLSPFKQDNLIPTDDGNTGDDDPPIEELDEYQILQLETGIK